MTTKTTLKSKPVAVKKVAVKKPPAPKKKTTPNNRVKSVGVKSLSGASKAKGAPQTAKDKPKKIKMVRDTFTMPESDFEKLAELKKKCIAAGVPVKKSELLRVGLVSILKLSTTALVTAVKQVVVKKQVG